MIRSIPLVIIIFAHATSAYPTFGQSNLLDGVQYRSVNLLVNDVIYDHTRDVLYASVAPSALTQYRNSVVTIDPDSGEVIDSIFLGREPNKLAISSDGSRVYVGLDRERAFRWWDPSSDTAGPLRFLYSALNEPAIAEDLAVPMGQSGVVVVSKDDVRSSASGDLEVFADTDSKSAVGLDASLITFVDEKTLISFYNHGTDFTTIRWSRDGLNMTMATFKSRIVERFNIEAEASTNGRIYYSNGVVADASNLTPVGAYDIQGLDATAMVEHVPALNLTYFVGSYNSGRAAYLSVFDGNTLAELDSISIPASIDSGNGKLIAAGTNRLAFTAYKYYADDYKTLTIISNVPVVMAPEPHLAAILYSVLLSAILSWRRR